MVRFQGIGFNHSYGVNRANVNNVKLDIKNAPIENIQISNPNGSRNAKNTDSLSVGTYLKINFSYTYKIHCSKSIIYIYYIILLQETDVMPFFNNVEKYVAEQFLYVLFFLNLTVMLYKYI